MANSSFTRSFYTKHNMPVLIDCHFTVDGNNANGTGVSNLKGPGVSAVYMHSSAPIAANPNPASGVILVQLSDTYFRYFSGSAQMVASSGASSTATVANAAEVITALGTATLAQWQAVGLPVGITPAVGAAFIATSTATIGGSATVAPTPATGSNIDHIEVLGDPTMTMNPTGIGLQPGVGLQGGYLVLQCFKNQAVAAPSNSAAIKLNFYLSNSSVTVSGE